MIGAFDTSGRANLGHALEMVVLNELERRKTEVTYVKTDDGFVVDFLTRDLLGGEEIVQVCADPTAAGVAARELRALAAAREHPRAAQRLLVLTREQVSWVEAPGVRVQPTHEWLLGEK